MKQQEKTRVQNIGMIVAAGMFLYTENIFSNEQIFHCITN